MTGNGKHTTYQIVNLGMVYYCFTNIICAIGLKYVNIMRTVCICVLYE